MGNDMKALEPISFLFFVWWFVAYLCRLGLGTVSISSSNFVQGIAAFVGKRVCIPRFFILDFLGCRC